MKHILEPIDDKDLATLHAKFIVPIAVNMMLNEEEPLDDIAEYSIHDIIGGLQPDTALLCIALCCQYITANIDHLLIAKALRAEADMVINEYGPLWLAHASGKDIDLDDKFIYEMLEHIPEDLESISELLTATCAELDDSHQIAAILCDILEVQASSHKEFAEFELAQLKGVSHEAVDQSRQQPESYSDNIIMFPQAH